MGKIRYTETASHRNVGFTIGDLVEFVQGAKELGATLDHTVKFGSSVLGKSKSITVEIDNDYVNASANDLMDSGHDA